MHIHRKFDTKARTANSKCTYKNVGRNRRCRVEKFVWSLRASHYAYGKGVVPHALANGSGIVSAAKPFFFTSFRCFPLILSFPLSFASLCYSVFSVSCHPGIVVSLFFSPSSPYLFFTLCLRFSFLSSSNSAFPSACSDKALASRRPLLERRLKKGFSNSDFAL